MNGNFPSSSATNPSSTVTIVTDSVAQIPTDIAQQLNIQIMSFTVTVKDTIYTDGVDLNPGNLYQRMRREKDLPVKTSAPSVGEFYSAFKQCYENGAKNILYVGLTGKLSGAINAATVAAKMLGEETNIPQIKIFDSRLATIAEGFLAMEAARLANQGINLDQLLKHLEEERQRVGFAAGLETLEYLARSGRISKALYLFGNATKILPIVSLNNDGKVVLVSRAIGYHQVLKEIVHYVSHEVAGFHKLSLAVMHADAIRWAETLKEMAVEQIHPDDIMITDFTPVMVAHSGPGMIGMAYHWRP